MKTTFQVNIPLLEEPLDRLSLDMEPSGRYWLTFVGSRDDVQQKLHELHRLVREALYSAGTSPLANELWQERHRVYVELHRVFGRWATDRRIADTIIENLKEALGDA